VAGERATWRALVLAASRGPDDPMARAFGVSHKCLVEVAGRPMLARVIEALRGCERIGGIVIIIEEEEIARQALGGSLPEGVSVMKPRESAASSVMAAARGGDFPQLVTTADHALLDGRMLEHFLAAAEAMDDADLAVALARAEVVEGAYPEVARTWLRLGGERVSSCNLFALNDERALKAVSFWRKAEKNRKRPWKIALSLGPVALLRMIFGGGGAGAALEQAGRRLGVVARPVFMPMAEAAVDVDKPSDHALAERILADRQGPSGA